MFSFLKRYKLKKELATVEQQLKNNEICMLYWSHGEMGYQQTTEEIEDLEQEKVCLERQKRKILAEV